MSSLQNDEETPLLPPKTRTPIPWFQFSIVLVLQLAEPLTSQVIYPFTPQLIRDIGITGGDETRVGYYVGMLQSLFFLTQALTVLHWSRLSDRIGRKPVILIGLFGLSLSMYCFGLSRTFWGLVLSRSLNGALNGNIGVIKSIMAELTDESNIAQLYAFMPIAWSTGGTLGPIIGGSLSRPAERFPKLFGDSDFLKKYPYFLPCAVPATFSAVAWLVTYIFLKETVPSPLSMSRLFRSKTDFAPQKAVASEELSASSLPSSDDSGEKPVPLLSLLTPRVVIAASNYAFLSLVDIAFRSIHPVFLSTPIHLGGLGFPPPQIGTVLAVFGVLNGLFQLFFFARIHDRWGSKKVFTVGIVSALPVFALFPIINYLARMQGLSTMVWALVYVQIVISITLSLSYGAIFIYITAAAPSRGTLGAVNGLAQMSVSVMRAIGPAAANSLFSLSIENNYLGGSLVYAVLICTVCVSIVVASMLPARV